jgi:hypothetical protein
MSRRNDFIILDSLALLAYCKIYSADPDGAIDRKRPDAPSDGAIDRKRPDAPSDGASAPNPPPCQLSMDRVHG